MPSKIPAIGASNWGTELNTIFTDVTTSSDLSKPIPGTAYAGGGRAMIDPRAIAAADLTLYVSPSGTDPVAGVAVDFDMGLSLAKSFKTIKAVVEYACKLQHQSYKITIKVSDGTYQLTTPVTINSTNYISIEGNAALPQNVKLETDKGGFIIETPATISGVSFRCIQVFNSTSNPINYRAIYSLSATIISDCGFDNYKYACAAKSEIFVENTINVVNCQVAFWSIFGGTVYMDAVATVNSSASASGIGYMFYVQAGSIYTYGGTYSYTQNTGIGAFIACDGGKMTFLGNNSLTRKGILNNVTNQSGLITINANCSGGFVGTTSSSIVEFGGNTVMNAVVSGSYFLFASKNSVLSITGLDNGSSLSTTNANNNFAQCYSGSILNLPAVASVNIPNSSTKILISSQSSLVTKAGRTFVLNADTASGGYITD